MSEDEDAPYDWSPMLMMGCLVRAQDNLQEAANNWPGQLGPPGLYGRLEGLADTVKALIEEITRYAQAEEEARWARPRPPST